MSWFETSGFASIAKNALKEAQKTIDKALDIHEGSSRASDATVCKSSSSPVTPGQVVNTQPPPSKSSVAVAEESASSSSISLVTKTSSNTEDSISPISEDCTPTTSKTNLDTDCNEWSWDTNKGKAFPEQTDSSSINLDQISSNASPNAEELVSESTSSFQRKLEGPDIEKSPSLVSSNETSLNDIAEDGGSTNSFYLVSPISEAAPVSMEMLSPLSTDDSFSIVKSVSMEDHSQVKSPSEQNITFPDSALSPAITRQPTSMGSDEPKTLSGITLEDESICSSIHSASTSSTLTVLETSANLDTGLLASTVEKISNIRTQTATLTVSQDRGSSSPELSRFGVGDTGDNNEDQNETDREPLFLEISSDSHDSRSTRGQCTKDSGDFSAHSSAGETATSSDIEIISSPSLDGNNGNEQPSLPSQRKKADTSSSTSPKSSNQGSRSSPFCTLRGDLEKETLASSITTSFTSITESDTDFSHIGSSEIASLEMNRIGQALTEYHSKKGHFRSKSSVSETSESSSDHSELDKLIRKISQLNEILEIRESKVLELSHSNSALQESNQTLNKRVKELEGNRGAEETETVREEYTQRLATMEKKFQQALREKEQNQKTIDELKVETACRKSSAEIEKEINEKNTLIEELRNEGEKLSKQQLNYSNIIKKLRAKEKENDSTIKSQTKQIVDQTSELDRLQKQLCAKDELERQQIEAIRQFTLANQRQEIELKDLKADKEESEGKARALKDALDTAYREMAEIQKSVATEKDQAQQLALNSQIAAKEKVEEALQAEKRLHQQEKNALIAQIHELQESLQSLESQYNRKERQLKSDLSEMERRLAESEHRNDEMSNAISAATRPLLKQLEGLQASHKAQQTTWEVLESSLTERLKEATRMSAASSVREKQIEEENRSLLVEKEVLKGKACSFEKQLCNLRKQFDDLQQKMSLVEATKSKDTQQLEALKRSFADEISELKKEREVLEKQLNFTKTALMDEKTTSETLQDTLKEKDRRLAHIEVTRGARSTPPPSPTLSRASFSGDSIHSAQWTEVFESSHRGGSLYDSLVGNSAVTVDIMTSTLRQREGELHQLQAELSRNEAQKDTLAKELVEVSRTVEELSRKITLYEEKESNYSDMRKKYDALLQMYGEKIEQLEELELDLSDVKEMYKAQIDQLLRK